MEGSLKKLLDTESATGQNGEQNFWSGSSILLFRFPKIQKDYSYYQQIKIPLDTSLTSPFMITYREKTKEESK